MTKVWVIGLNTFREAIRNKVLYSLLFFALLLILAATVFGELAVGAQLRLTTDLGLASMSLFLVIIAIFVGVNLVYKELQLKTVYTLLPKPIYRFQFVLGKYFGLILTLLAMAVVMAVVLTGMLIAQEGPVGGPLVRMLLLVTFEVLVVTAIAVLFSSFSTPLLSGLFTVGIFMVGRSVPDIRAIAGKVGGVLGALLESVATIVPNLRFFYVTGSVVEGEHVSINGTMVDWGYVVSAAGYASLYIVLLLLGAITLFARRDFV
jgi:ABC-type transport system involved in multi-copper enzyme maturation permease subunit